MNSENAGRHDVRLKQETMPGVKMSGIVFDIQRYCLNDGPGIRTTVFLKGCPLRCLWCCNPESQIPRPELFYNESLCTRCYRCIEICPHHAVTIEDGGAININRKLCEVCGKCVEACPNEARAITGKRMTVEEVLDVVRKDGLFYRNSGGGVTVSGGEAAFQSGFTLEILKGSQGLGLHTALETCGYTDTETLDLLIKHADLVLFDIKHMDPEAHHQLTGAENELVLANLRMVARSGVQVILRMPIIPGCNDSEENLRAAGDYIYHLGLKKVDIIPYHKLGIAKYRRLGKEYQLEHLVTMKAEDVETVEKILKSYGLEVHQA